MHLDEARELITKTLERCRTSPANASSVADALLAAELFGQSGHGIRRLPSYAAQSLSGKVDGMATPKSDEVTQSVLRIDAQRGFAYPALDIAQSQLPKMAKEQGIALALIQHSHHCGVAGVQVERLAQQGLLSLFFTNTPSAMAPYNGNKAVFGTNPIAFGLPRADEPPLVIDLSLSKTARGHIMAAEQKGEKLEEGLALDSHGNPTTDPSEALSGTMLPLGDAKGTALALMVELLTAGLTGSNYAMDASSFFTPDGDSPSIGQLIITISPERLGTTSPAHFETLLTAITDQPNVRLPGSRRFSISSNIEKHGIEIDDNLKQTIDSIGN